MKKIVLFEESNPYIYMYVGQMEISGQSASSVIDMNIHSSLADQFIMKSGGKSPTHNTCL